MRDQYGQPVPADLRVLPPFNYLDDTERVRVFKADWYEANGVLLADVVGDDPRDAGLEVDADGNLEGVEVLRVDDILKRGNSDDGFYHA